MLIILPIVCKADTGTPKTNATQQLPSVASYEDITPNPHRDCAARYYCVLTNVLDVRARLKAYDLKLRLLQDHPHMFNLGQLNAERGELLHDALTPYFFLGPVYLPDDPAELDDLLTDPATEYWHMQMPATLDELVELNILPHLPKSPYDTGEYLYIAPDAPPSPGDVHYISYGIVGEYLSGVPNAREAYMLAVYGHPGSLAISRNEAAGNMIGDPGLIEPFIHKNLVYFTGIDPDTA